MLGAGVIACAGHGLADAAGSEEGRTSTSDEGGTSGVGSTSTGAGDASTETTAGAPGSSGESGSTGGEESTTGVMPACPPQVESSFDVRIEPQFDGYGDEDVDWACTVLERVLFPAGATLMLACTDGGVAVEPPPQLILNTWPAVPSLAVAVGATIRVRYARRVDVWTNWDVLRVEAADATLLVAGQAGFGSFDPFIDVGQVALDPLCEPVSDGCAVIQHERLGLTIEGVQGEVQSREYTEIGAHGVWAPRMAHNLNFDCPSDALTGFDLLIVRLSP